MRLRLTLALTLVGLVVGGAAMWSRWGTLVWLDSAIAFCL